MVAVERPTQAEDCATEKVTHVNVDTVVDAQLKKNLLTAAVKPKYFDSSWEVCLH